MKNILKNFGGPTASRRRYAVSFLLKLVTRTEAVLAAFANAHSSVSLQNFGASSATAIVFFMFSVFPKAENGFMNRETPECRIFIRRASGFSRNPKLTKNGNRDCPEARFCKKFEIGIFPKFKIS